LAAKAQAPKPGKQRKADEVLLTLTVKVKDQEPVSMLYNMIPVAERIEVRKQVGVPLDKFLPNEGGELGLDSAAVLWWLARRASGEPGLRFSTCSAEFAKLALGIGDVELTLGDPDPEDDSPE
jgi:hypothetical protein